MKITAVEAHVCNARMRNWVFVHVLTDEDGLYGWGEATLEWHTRAIVGAVEDLAELIVGEDPTRIEHLWQMMFRQHFWHGNGIVRGTAISGIDIALWDILGKVHGVPCHKLWGGPVRDYVRLYCHLGGGKMEDFYESSEPQRFGELAAGMVEKGFTAFKSMAVPPTMPLEGLAPVRHAERCVAAMREAVGDEIDIMVDCHARPSPRMGHLFAAALEQFGLYWFEEPCWPERVDDIAAIQRAVRTPIATGERLVGAAPFNELLTKGACSVIQPDITHCGGLTEVRRIAALAEIHRVALAPHNPQGPVIDRGLDRARARDAVVHHLRGGHLRRAVARRGRERVPPDRPEGDARPGDRPAGARDRDRPRRRRASTRSSRSCRSGSSTRTAASATGRARSATAGRASGRPRRSVPGSGSVASSRSFWYGIGCDGAPIRVTGASRSQKQCSPMWAATSAP